MSFTRNCPRCQKELNYSSKGCVDSAIKKNSICKKCAAVTTGFISKYATKGKNTGKDNSFFGKTHSIDFKIKISKRQTGKKATKETKKKISKATSGINNPRYGKNNYDLWIEKYGIEEANKRLIACKAKQSKNNSGKGNPMYGKPVPYGSGYGWKGWYKGWFFRSLRELSYVVKVLEANNLKWESAETTEYLIEYQDYLGHDRTYKPDFLIEGKKLVEIKPKRLHNTNLVKLKLSAANRFCSTKGLTYELVDVELLSDEEIRLLYISNKIQFTKKYEVMYKEKYKC